MPTADECDDDGPSFKSIHDLEEFGCLGRVHPLLALHLVLVPCPLRFVEYDDVFMGDGGWVFAVIVQKRVNVLDEGGHLMLALFAPTPGTLLAQDQRFSHHIDQGNVARQKNP